MSHIIMIDNFDSFTYNLVDLFRMHGDQVTVYRNNVAISTVLKKIKEHQSLLVISPGPGNPQEAGICLELIRASRSQTPILGICLGHQSIVEAYGGVVSRAEDIVHGKSYILEHEQHPIFAGLPETTLIGRYHSLVATKVPGDLKVIATTENKKYVMAVADDADKVYGLQFHPESILTTYGYKMLHNIKELQL